MDLLQSIVLGLIQGFTEWLPISSTGHLRLAEHFFGLSVPLLFDVTLHAGTLLVTLLYFRKDIINILSSLWHRNLKSQDGKLILPIIAGSIPTALIAYLWGNELDGWFNTLSLLGAGLIVSGALLVTSKFTKETKNHISYPVAVLIGIMQGLSIIPSISRSGITIAVMLLLGIKRELAFKFSFLLSIPAIIGALGLTLYQEHDAFVIAGISPLEVTAALVVTVAVSFLALKILFKSLQARKFWMFSIYCLVLGAALVLFSLIG
ncbi:MAG: undecaprenyl-diphosphate phosphatase [Candidatus Bathyarchaeota archaeon]|nr:undecaprenyl-diphosphate phosphatase [Candidatus Bathyarchaeota archaeon]